MKAAVISYGSVKDLHFHRELLKGCSLIICADGGLYHAQRMNIKPHGVVGDFDSYARESVQDFEGIEVVRYLSKKNETDTQLAVEYALSKGAKHVLLLGAIGTRIDHTVANLGLLMFIAEGDAVGEIIDEYNRITIIKSRTLVRGKGSIVSLIPYGGAVEGVTLKGFEYPLEDFSLEMGSTRGVSNVLIDDVGEINVTKGWLLVIKSRD